MLSILSHGNKKCLFIHNSFSWLFQNENILIISNYYLYLKGAVTRETDNSYTMETRKPLPHGLFHNNVSSVTAPQQNVDVSSEIYWYSIRI